jgi:hypothetical protein
MLATGILVNIARQERGHARTSPAPAPRTAARARR